MMKPIIHTIAIAVALVFSISSASAQTLCTPWSVQADTLFLRAHTSAGANVDNLTDYEASQRLSISGTGISNIGSRFSWFNWEHEGIDPAGTGVFDTTNLDLEFFKKIDLSKWTNVEMSAGVRYNDTESMFGGVGGDFDGYGGIVGLRPTVALGSLGNLYAKAKWAILMGNGEEPTEYPLTPGNFDVVRKQTEIGFGYEMNRALGRVIITPRVGAEWINFEGYGPSVDGPADFALGGFLIGLGVGF